MRIIISTILLLIIITSCDMLTNINQQTPTPTMPPSPTSTPMITTPTATPTTTATPTAEIDYSTYNIVKDGINNPSYFYMAQTEGEFLYTACGAQGVFIYDNASPEKPILLSKLDCGINIDRIIPIGDYLIASSNDSKNLFIINASDKVNPSITDQYTCASFVYDILLYNNKLYVGMGANGLVELDMSALPTITQLRANTDLGRIRNMDRAGNAIYTINYDTLSVLNIASFTIDATRDLTEAWDIAAEGNHLFICGYDYSSGSYIDIYNIDSPASPTFVSKISDVGYPCSLDVTGNTLYLADECDIRVYNVADIDSPTHIKTFDTNGNNEVVTIQGGYVYADNCAGFDIIKHETLEIVDSQYFGGSSWETVALGVKDNTVYYMYDFSGLQIIDVTTPLNPVIESCYFMFHDLILEDKIYVEEESLYFPGSPNYLSRYNISDPTNVTRDKTYSTNGDTGSVYVKNNYLYAAEGMNLLIIDLSTDTTIKTLEQTTGINTIYIADNNYGYIAAENNIIVFNNQTPASAIAITTFTLPSPGTVTHITGDTNYLYVASELNGIYILDITDPYNPALTGSIGTTNPLQIELFENHIFVAEGTEGVKIIDVTNPTLPVLEKSITTSGNVMDIEYLDDFIYAADKEKGLLIIGPSSN